MNEEKNNYPLLSILVAAYNIELYIGECIESLLNQTYPNTEIIIVDDGSTDGTPAILEKYNKFDNIRIIRKENGGTGTTRNLALTLAKGEFITFVDGDDVIAPDSYSANMNYFFENKEIDIVQYPLLFGWTSSKPYKNMPHEELLDKKKSIYLKYMQNLMTFSMCDKIYRKSVIVGHLRFPEGMLYEDMDTNNQLIHLCRKVQISEHGCYYYRRTENSNTTQKMTFKKIHDYFLQTTNFLSSAQNNGVSNSALNIFIVRWLRIPELGFFEELKDNEKKIIENLCKNVQISKPLMVLQLIIGKISLRKFLSLNAFANNNIELALSRCRRKKDRPKNGSH